MTIKRLVGFSGGADSQATALWVRQRFPPEDVILLNSQAGRNEHPLTTGFIRWYSEHIFPVIEVIPLIKDLGNIGTKGGKSKEARLPFKDEDELTFARLAAIKGRFPSSQAQFCTKFLKLVPSLRWCEENLTLKGITFERYVGVRWDESAKRACLPDGEWDVTFGCQLWRPIAAWSKKMVFRFLEANGEDVNPLYRMGFSRVGCAPCINAGKDDIRLWAARCPEMIDKVRQWEKQVGRTFFPPLVPGKELNWVDEVVVWSKTERGGKQKSLLFVEAEAADGSCVSKYGLCE